MQITLPDDPKLIERAQAAGFQTIEEYLLDLVQRETQEDSDHQDGPPSAEEWVSRFQAFLKTLTSRNPDVDDSRESIYPVR